jgi:methylmalonyl-CoA/ethylmalonyl-CoA epimerase
MLKVEHIGIAVKKLTDSIPLFEKLLNSPCYKTETVESEMVITAFFRQGDTKMNFWKAAFPMALLPGSSKKKERVFIILPLRSTILKKKWNG